MKKIRKSVVIVCGLASFCLTSMLTMANSPAQVTRESSLHQLPTAQSPVIKSLTRDQEVMVLDRKGGWYRVDVLSQTGWIKLFNLRFASVNEGDGRTGLGSLLDSVKKPHSDVTLTTGVRGITEKQLRESKPDFAELQKIVLFKSDKNQAQYFAAQAGLVERKVKQPQGKE